MPAEGSWFWVEGMIDLFFYVDLVLNFFVAYEVRPRGARGGLAWQGSMFRNARAWHLASCLRAGVPGASQLSKGVRVLRCAAPQHAGPGDRRRHRRPKKDCCSLPQGMLVALWRG